MSRLETLAPQSAVDFSRSVADPDPYAHPHHVLRITASPFSDLSTNANNVHNINNTDNIHNINNINSISNITVEEDISDTDTLFPGLPPLLSGHPSVHLRHGIMEAARLATEHVPDAERAFFVADLGEVYKQHVRWTRALPGVQPFYAVKCNPDPYIIRLLASLGAGFDCASHNEIRLVLDTGGIAPSSIIFANPCKAPSFIRAAASLGVRMVTFDNADELAKLARAHPRAQCIVRILTDDSRSLCAFGIKFGAPLPTVPGLLARARELGLEVVGVSFHVGSGCYDPSVYADALSRAARVFEMGREAGFKFSVLDVGGGFEDALFEEAAGVIRAGLERYFPRGEGGFGEGVRVIAEPGRFYVSKAFSLAASVIARRAPLVKAGEEENRAKEEEEKEDKEKDEEDRPEVMYYINDGVYGAFNCILFDHQSPVPQPLCLSSSFHIPPASPSFPYGAASLWGPTCDSIDCVARKCMLPKQLRVGDWLGFEGMGAYTRCAASEFNGFEVSRVVYTDGGSGGGIANGNGGGGTEDVGREVRRALARWAARGYGMGPVPLDN